MKYVLVDKGDNIVDRVELESEVGLSGAKTFFIDGFDPGRKQIDRKEFDKIWKVMTEDEYCVIQSKKPIEWWIEDKKITDEELK